MKKHFISAVLILMVAFSSTAIATPIHSLYDVDVFGNHRINIDNKGYTVIYCNIRGFNGAWSSMAVLPNTQAVFHIWSPSNESWNCDG